MQIEDREIIDEFEDRENEVLAIHLSSAVERASITIEEYIQTRTLQGASADALLQELMDDLNNGGRIFGEFRNAIKATAHGNLRRVSDIGNYAENGLDIKYVWVTVQDTKVCPDCAPRHGETQELRVWEDLGAPRSGWSICRDNCRCFLAGTEGPAMPAESVKRVRRKVKKQAQSNEKKVPKKQTRGHLPDMPQSKQIEQVAKDMGIKDKKEAGRIKESINKFTSSDYWGVRKLQQGNLSKIKDVERIRKIEKDVETFLEKSPVFKGEVSRGIAVKSSKSFENLKIGDIIDMKGSSSWSSNILNSKRYSAGANTKGVVFVMPKNNLGVSIKHLSDFSREDEVLFSKNVKFKISGKPELKKDGRLYIQVEAE